MDKMPEAITRDQKWYEAIHREMKEMRCKQDRIIQLLEQIAGVASDKTADVLSVKCPDCGKEFTGPQRERALRAHRRVHSRGGTG